MIVRLNENRVTCVKLNRRFIGIEKDPQSFEYAVSRIKENLCLSNAVT